MLAGLASNVCSLLRNVMASLPSSLRLSLSSITYLRPVLIAILFATFSLIKLTHNLNNALISYDGTVPASSLNQTRPSQPLATAAYAISITSCGKLSKSLYDAASVLKRSIELNSHPLHHTSRYAAHYYAFILKPDNNLDPKVVDKCYQLLELAGWTIKLEDTPLYPELIKEPPGSILKNGIRSDGCCGERELIKLATYKLTDYDFAVHLDLDTLIIHPFDELFNVMYFHPNSAEGKMARMQLKEIVAPTYLNRRMTGNPSTSSNNMSATEVLANITVDAYFTKDYNMIRPGQESQRVGVQGGFLVVRPSTSTYTHLVNLVYSGEFYGGFDARTSGWYKSGYGKHIWGSMTIQGLMAYYFDVEQLEHSVELNRCRYNNIADNARVSGFARNPKYPRCTLLPFVRNASEPRYNFDDKQCRDGRDTCDDTDCQRFPLSKMRMLHYTYCKSPWKCNGCEYLETYKEPTCYEMTREWFRVRDTIPGEEGTRNITNVKGNDNGPLSFIRDDGEVELREGNCFKEFYLGYCLDHANYVPMIQRNLSAISE